MITTPMMTGPRSAAFPQINVQTLFTMLFAGALATVAFDLFGQALAPAAGFAKLAPVGLAKSTLKTVFGAAPKGVGEMMHYATGMIAYPLGWLLVARPIWKLTLPSLHWAIPAAVYGVALWGHVVFALVAGWVIETRRVA
ncbi:MAG: hypothetical protein AAF360_17365 [Pseudomonadota bacterium]